MAKKYTCSPTANDAMNKINVEFYDAMKAIADTIATKKACGEAI